MLVEAHKTSISNYYGIDNVPTQEVGGCFDALIMPGDPVFSFDRSVPLPILYLLTHTPKKKSLGVFPSPRRRKL